MGMAAHGVLAYGYHLGGDGDWELEGTGEFDEEFPADWYDDEGDFADQAMVRMLVAAGLATHEQAAQGYWDGRDEAEQQLGVDFESTGSLDGRGHEGHILVAAGSSVRADWGEALELDVARMNDADQLAEWDERLAWALGVLGLTPKQEGPRWLLGANWG
ncbi:hypothetical protein [Streptomonospora arabica]|uniref:Uncharacterized protein n=1 Tax=Streptomonospora arabica TaxID=412417 RepID=A0ABV9SSM7_9ACTN